MIFLSGSPILEKVNGINTGRLSGIVNHHVPSYLTKNRMPSFETNCIEDWETKLDAIAHQQKILQTLLTQAQITEFGKEHQFEKTTCHQEFAEAVHSKEYENRKP